MLILDGVPTWSARWGTPLSRPGTGYPPSPDLGWGYPHHQQDEVPPGPDLGQGTPLIQIWDGVPPPIQTWDEVPPCPDLGWGTPCPDLGWFTPPHPDLGRGTPRLDLGWGTPPPPCGKCGQTENITFPHPSDAGGKDDILVISYNARK